MSIDPFGGEIREGKLYGRGASDTKGSIAAMVAALTNAVRRKQFREGDLDVYFCALMGEERSNDGARALMERGFKADFAVAGEPTACRIVYTHKGSLWLKIIASGKSAHGATPEKGDNAIGTMAEAVRFLLGDYTKSLRTTPVAALGSPTVNVGVIRGGTQTNIVPDRCEIEVDRRTVPGETHEQVLAQLRESLRHLPVEIETARECRPLYTEPQNAFVKSLVTATGLGEKALVGAPWFCDAAIFGEHGVPGVAFGPGNVAQAHTNDEWIALDEVYRTARILENWLLTSAMPG
jgi:acetylornithine deacetylase/succinyl-diaminopimelate desuccinylase-like protein